MFLSSIDSSLDSKAVFHPGSSGSISRWGYETISKIPSILFLIIENNCQCWSSSNMAITLILCIELQGVYLIFIHFRYQYYGQIVHLPMKFAKCQIYFSISYTKYEIFIPFSQPWSQLQSKRHLEVKIKIYTTSCFAVTQTTFSTPFLHHRILYSSIFWNFGKLQVSN